MYKKNKMQQNQYFLLLDIATKQPHTIINLTLAVSATTIVVDEIISYIDGHNCYICFSIFWVIQVF